MTSNLKTRRHRRAQQQGESRVEREEGSADHGSEEELVSGIRSSYGSATEKQRTDSKPGKGLKQHFSKGDPPTANEPVKPCSTSLVTVETTPKTQGHVPSCPLGQFQNPENDVAQDGEGSETPPTAGGGTEVLQPPQKSLAAPPEIKHNCHTIQQHHF